MSPRAVVTPENLSLDFVVDLLDDGPPVKINLNTAHFFRHAGTGVIGIVGAGAGGLTPAMTNLADVNLTGLGDGFVLIYSLAGAEWIVVDKFAPASIRAIYESNANRNGYTDAEKTKLASIAAGAQVNPTTAAMVTALNAYFGSAIWQGGPTVPNLATQTVSYALVQGDFTPERLILMEVAGANTVTIPADLTPGFPLTIMAFGAGQTTIAPGSGVTLKSVDGSRKLRTQNSTATLVPLSLNVYLLMGDIIP